VQIVKDVGHLTGSLSSRRTISCAASFKCVTGAVASARFWGWELVDDTMRLPVGNVGAMVFVLHNHQSLSHLP
jgi:hypothetical protein